MEIELVIPQAEHRAQVEDYKRKFLASVKSGGSINGVGRLSELEFDEWLKECHDQMHGRNLPEGFVPATMFLGIRKSDGKLVGTIHVRHALTSHLEEIGGHIGYGVAPDERRKGYATQMTQLALEKCRELGIDRVRITCLDNNIASEKVIEKCGGIFDGTATEKSGKYAGRTLKRYWVELGGGA